MSTSCVLLGTSLFSNISVFLLIKKKKKLYGELESRREVDLPSKLIGTLGAPQKVGIFSWEATWRKIMILDNIQKRGWAMTNRYFLCGKEEGSTDHLLIHYDLTRDLWHFIFSLFGVHWVLPSSVKGVLLSGED